MKKRESFDMALKPSYTMQLSYAKLLPYDIKNSPTLTELKDRIKT